MVVRVIVLGGQAEQARLLERHFYAARRQSFCRCRRRGGRWRGGRSRGAWYALAADCARVVIDGQRLAVGVEERRAHDDEVAPAPAVFLRHRDVGPDRAAEAKRPQEAHRRLGVQVRRADQMAMALPEQAEMSDLPRRAQVEARRPPHVRRQELRMDERVARRVRRRADQPAALVLDGIGEFPDLLDRRAEEGRAQRQGNGQVVEGRGGSGCHCARHLSARSVRCKGTEEEAAPPCRLGLLEGATSSVSWVRLT